jgi:hypothetical protein
MDTSFLKSTGAIRRKRQIMAAWALRKRLG